MRPFATQSTGHNPDFDLDLTFSEDSERQLVELFNAVDDGRQTIEVKREERQAMQTGNIFVEFAQTPQGQPEKPSGIATSPADWYAIHFGELVVLAETPYLKYAARKWGRDHPSSVVDGGVNGDNPTRGVLVPLVELARMVYDCRVF